jgi:hypothetical protein
MMRPVLLLTFAPVLCEMKVYLRGMPLIIASKETETTASSQCEHIRWAAAMSNDSKPATVSSSPGDSPP